MFSPRAYDLSSYRLFTEYQSSIPPVGACLESNQKADSYFQDSHAIIASAMPIACQVDDVACRVHCCVTVGDFSPQTAHVVLSNTLDASQH